MTSERRPRTRKPRVVEEKPAAEKPAEPSLAEIMAALEHLHERIQGIEHQLGQMRPTMPYRPPRERGK